MSLYSKHRPTTFDDMVGDFRFIEKHLRDSQKNHALLFTGPTGTGKTTAARIAARFLGAQEYDIQELDIGSEGGIDVIRRVIEESRYSSLGTQVYLFEECHRFSKPAVEAALKLLEDIPEHLYFLMTTSEPQKLLPTFRGRCITIEMPTIPDKDMVEILTRVCEAEGNLIHVDWLEDIAKASGGSARVAINTLEEFYDTDEKLWPKILKRVGAGPDSPEIIDLCREVAKDNPDEDTVCRLLQGLKDNKVDPESIRRAVLGYLTTVYLKGGSAKLIRRAQHLMPNTYDTGFAGLVVMVAGCW